MKTQELSREIQKNDELLYIYLWKEGIKFGFNDKTFSYSYNSIGDARFDFVKKQSEKIINILKRDGLLYRGCDYFLDCISFELEGISFEQKIIFRVREGYTNSWVRLRDVERENGKENIKKIIEKIKRVFIPKN